VWLVFLAIKREWGDTEMLTRRRLRLALIASLICFVSPVARVYADDAPTSNNQPADQEHDQPTDQDDGPVKMGVPNDNLGKTTGDVCYTGHCSPWGSYLLPTRPASFRRVCLISAPLETNRLRLRSAIAAVYCFNRRPIF
jgi:hypothetical protein